VKAKITLFDAYRSIVPHAQSNQIKSKYFNEDENLTGYEGSNDSN